MDALALLELDERKDLLRFITAGSVDDGKSTLIGRLLYEARGIYEDQLASVRKASAQRAATDGELDFSLFTDGLKAEREQNITIDVAYRYFSTPRRKFIIADTPGHEQYTRNMVTGASTASLMVILIDATKGLLLQSRRHAFIASLLGIRHILVVINKMDLVEYRQEIYENIRQEFTDYAAKLQATDVTFVPASALRGDNVVERGGNMPWYQGTTLLNYLETVHIASDRNVIDLRFPVQYVSRPDRTFRGYMGTVASGVIRRGDEIMVLPSGMRSRVKAVFGPDGEIPEAFAPMTCCVTLADELDASRGSMLVHPRNLPHLAANFEAMLVWIGGQPLQTGDQYLIKHTTTTVTAQITQVQYRIDVNTLHRQTAGALAVNEVGRVAVVANQPIAHDPYGLNRATGAFVVIDRKTHNTVGAGMILSRESAERLATSTHIVTERASLVTPQHRRKRLGHAPATVWLKGSADKASEIAAALEKTLFDTGAHCHLLRERDVSAENIAPIDRLRRLANIAAVLNQAGLIVICACQCESSDERRIIREEVAPENLVEVELAPDRTVEQATKDIVDLLASRKVSSRKPGEPADGN